MNVVALDPTEVEVEDKAPTVDNQEVLILDDPEDSPIHEESEESENDESEEDFDAENPDEILEEDSEEEALK